MACQDENKAQPDDMKSKTERSRNGLNFMRGLLVMTGGKGYGAEPVFTSYHKGR
jgi:hypothetical protein